MSMILYEIYVISWWARTDICSFALPPKSIKHHMFNEHHWWCFQTSISPDTAAFITERNSNYIRWELFMKPLFVYIHFFQLSKLTAKLVCKIIWLFFFLMGNFCWYVFLCPPQICILCFKQCRHEYHSQ